jgi:hypothetical protein
MAELSVSIADGRRPVTGTGHRITPERLAERSRVAAVVARGGPLVLLGPGLARGAAGSEAIFIF